MAEGRDDWTQVRKDKTQVDEISTFRKRGKKRPKRKTINKNLQRWT